MAEGEYPLIFLDQGPERQKFKPVTGGDGQQKLPDVQRSQHARYLQHQLQQALNEVEVRATASRATKGGFYLEFDSAPGFDLTTKSLEDRGAGIRLLNVRNIDRGEERIVRATVFVPKSKSGHFVKKIADYETENTPVNQQGETRPRNQKLVQSVAEIRAALLDAFWTDDPSKMPGNQPDWVEVWLDTREEEAVDHFRHHLKEVQIEEHPTQPLIQFPERAVLMIRANRDGLLKMIDHSDQLAELRAGREPCSFFVDLQNADQAAWVDDLLNRLEVDPDSQLSVCILDSGVNQGHPLLTPLLDKDDCQTVEAAWGTHDQGPDGPHGTRMAGICAYGDLQGALIKGGPVVVRHRLESVKIVPDQGQTPKQLWGHVTAQGVSRAEIQAPARQRVYCLAVTSKDERTGGKPTSWSGAVDSVAAGVDGNGCRLIFVSGGNADQGQYSNYPNSNFTDEIHDPAQAWNALTVGATTQLVNIVHPDYRGYSAIAEAGGLAPSGCTSVAWDKDWPVKPEVVFEGGNAARSGLDTIAEPDELQILTTWHEPSRWHFAPFCGTSAATARAAEFAAKVWLEYPDSWPETVRALIVHSAEWTEPMLNLRTSQNKSGHERLLRCVGYGEPNLDNAIACLRNRLTLVEQATIKPFAENSSGDVTMNEMNIHELPWPRDVLLQLGQVPVKMRVTLSYFIDPGPGEVGWKHRYRYPSHGLRFELKSPGESREEFEKRINMSTREQGEGGPGTPSAVGHWTLGPQLRDKGSVHSDIWKGTAADLATSNVLAIYPTSGWWKERRHLFQWRKDARYSLVVSIYSEAQGVDIYTPVALQLAVPIAVQVAP